MSKLNKAREKRARRAAKKDASRYARENTEANRRREYLARLSALNRYLLRLVTFGVSPDDDRAVQTRRRINELEEWMAEGEAERKEAE